MLRGIDAVLTGEILLHLDRMGHSDLVAIVDAHFPAYRVGKCVVDVAVGSPRATRAICSVVELDDVEPFVLMDSGKEWNSVQRELVAASGVPEVGVGAIDRYAFYELAERANLIVRTTETRIYGNAVLRKGVTPDG